MTSYEDCATQRITERAATGARNRRPYHAPRLPDRASVKQIRFAAPSRRDCSLRQGRENAASARRSGDSDDPARYAPLRQLWGTAPEKGGQQHVISIHGNPYSAVFGDPTSPRRNARWCSWEARRATRGGARSSRSPSGRDWLVVIQNQDRMDVRSGRRAGIVPAVGRRHPRGFAPANLNNRPGTSRPEENVHSEQ